MKKIFKSLLVVALLLVQLVPMMNVRALNDNVDDTGTSKDENGNYVTTGSITINNVVAENTYSIYKILELESYDDENDAYAYIVTESWEGFFAEGQAGLNYVTIDTEGYVYWKEGVAETEAAQFAKDALAYAKANGITATASKTASATDTSLVFDDLELGYYLVDSTLGALCGLTTTHLDAVINEKNGVPTVDKLVQEDETEEWGKANTAEIGETVNYETTITAEKGAENYVLYDKMTAGLTYTTGSVAVKLDYYDTTKTDKVLVKGTDYVVDEVSTDNYTFKITFSTAIENELVDGDKLVVTYSAVVNENAEIGTTGNMNDTHLTYGDENETSHSTTLTYVLGFDLVKSNGQKQLEGAEFELYDAAIGGNKIALVYDSENDVYRVATAAEQAVEGFESAIIVAGSVTIEGLDDDVYYLEEITPPDGYNKLASRVKLDVQATINDANVLTGVLVNGDSESAIYSDESALVTVINTTGALLPETGGIGTVLFITIGSLMVLGFGVLLVTKLRLAKEM